MQVLSSSRWKGSSCSPSGYAIRGMAGSRGTRPGTEEISRGDILLRLVLFIATKQLKECCFSATVPCSWTEHTVPLFLLSQNLEKTPCAHSVLFCYLRPQCWQQSVVPRPEMAEDTEGLQLTGNFLAVPSPSASSQVGEAGGQYSNMHLYPPGSGCQEQGS